MLTDALERCHEHEHQPATAACVNATLEIPEPLGGGVLLLHVRRRGRRCDSCQFSKSSASASVLGLSRQY
jgi:hypothetical protein